MPEWKRTLWVLFFANVATATGMMAMVPFLTFYVEELGVHDPAARNLWSGLVVGAAPVVAALLGPVWGGISDRFGRKIMVLRALAAIVVFVGLMGLVQSVEALLALRVLQGAFSGYIPTSITFVSVLAPAGEQGRIGARIQSAMPAGTVGGYILGGLMSEAGYVRWIFPLCSLLALAGFLAVALLTRDTVEDRSGAPKSIRGIAAQIAGGLRYVATLPKLTTLLGAIVVVRFLVSTVDPVYARYVLELGGDKDDAGYVMSLQALMLLLFMPVWGRIADRIGAGYAFVLSAAGVAASFCAQGLAPDVGWLYVLRAAGGIALAGVFPTAYVMAGRESAPERRGAAMGVVFMAVALAHALGSIAGGGLLNALGFRTLFFVIAAVVLALSGTGFVMRRRRRARAPA